MIEGVIFDMDGVLVDNKQAHIEAFGELFKKHGIEFSASDLLPYFGMTNDAIFAALAPDLQKKCGTEALGNEKEAIYREIFARTMKPVAGLVDLLKALKKAGFKTAVGSSGGTDNVNFVLKGCGIEKYIDKVANGDMISKGKPDPEVYLLAAELLGLRPDECVVCEDAFVGVEAARRAGMKVVVLATTYPRSEHKDYDILIDDFTQVTVEDIIAMG